MKNQQVIEQKNKQIVIKNTNIQNQGAKQQPSQRNQANAMVPKNQMEYYKNGQIGQGGVQQ